MIRSDHQCCNYHTPNCNNNFNIETVSNCMRTSLLVKIVDRSVFKSTTVNADINQSKRDSDNTKVINHSILFILSTFVSFKVEQLYSRNLVVMRSWPKTRPRTQTCCCCCSDSTPDQTVVGRPRKIEASTGCLHNATGVSVVGLAVHLNKCSTVCSCWPGVPIKYYT